MAAEFGPHMDQITLVWHEIIFFFSFFGISDLENIYPECLLLSLCDTIDVLAAKESNSAAILEFGHFRVSRGLLDIFFGIYDPKHMRNDTSLDVLCRFTKISILSRHFGRLLVSEAFPLKSGSPLKIFSF